MAELFIKDRYLNRKSWRRLSRGDYSEEYIEVGGFRGVVGVLRLNEISEPLRVAVCGVETVIADSGFTWVELLPEGGNFCLTSMYSPEGELVQIYFDITLENFTDSPAHFRDLFLDITVNPDGAARLIDEDELDEALSLGIITDAEHRLAHETAAALLSAFPTRIRELDGFLRSIIKATPHNSRLRLNSSLT